MLQMFDEVHKYERKAHGLQCVYCKRFLSQIVAMSEERREAAERKCEELQKKIGNMHPYEDIKRFAKMYRERNQLELFDYEGKKGV